MFSQLVEGVVIKAQAETISLNADMFRDVIRYHIQTWLDDVENKNPLYKVSELIPVGSYAERTKIIQPDEFDYLAVIEVFSKPNMIAIDAEESDIQRGLVKVIVDDEELKSKCRGLCKDGHLKCFQPINFPNLDEDRFGHVLIQTLMQMVKSSKNLIMALSTPTNIDCRVLLPIVQGVSLIFIGALFRAPNVIITFEYKGIEVSVDISPAIRYHKIHECFSEKDCASPEFAELVLSRKSLLLIGTSSQSDFKITVTEAEVEYIQKVMKTEHKIIYIFLKYIVKLFNEQGGLPFPFTSYMMKTVCIHHEVNCKKKERSIKECFKSVIENMHVCKQQKCVTSIIHKQINIGRPEFIDEWEQECLLRGIDQICLLPTYITTVEEFSSFVKKIVRDEHKKRSDENEERSKRLMEVQDRYRAELDAKFMQVVDMGFDPVEVRKVMDIYDPDLDTIVFVLKKRANRRAEEEEKKLKQKNSSSIGPVPDFQTQLGRADGEPEKPYNTANSSQDQSTQSEQVPLTLALAYTLNPVTYEILYERDKGV